MGLYKIDKNIVLLDGKSIILDINIPFRGELDENRDYSFIEDNMIHGLYSGTRKAIDAYQISELPNKFTEKQKIIVTNRLPQEILGHFADDNVYLDADSMQGIRSVKPEFLFSREVGHKILKYIDTDKALEDLGNIFGINYEYYQSFLNEIFADACGNIASNEDSYYVYGEEIDVNPSASEAIKKRTLYNIYHI